MSRRYTEVYKVDVPEGKSGIWAVEKFTVSQKDSEADRVRALINPRSMGRFTPPGTYTQLKRGNDIIMSDTPDEIRDHIYFITRAYGSVLIAGLGLGMVLNAVATNNDVEKVTVVEKSPDVIKLVADHYRAKPYGSKLEIVEADIFEWKPAKGVTYNHAWFDIWDNLCTDNLDEMATLNRRFARICPSKGSWGRELLLDRRRQERNSPWYR
jgi:hypothetical protein